MRGKSGPSTITDIRSSM